jgi:glucosamine--fructose-6-phosphate aminotransferase (isomerizing)
MHRKTKRRVKKMETLMRREILSRSAALKNTYQTNLELAEKLAAAVKERGITHVLVSARGSSNNALVYFKYLCEIYAGLPVTFVNPSVITLYGAKLNMKNTLVLGVSQSGKALDVLLVMQEAERQGALTAAVTNNLLSPLALNSKYHFYLDVGEELSVAATKTFTAQMLVMKMLATSLTEGEEKMPARMLKLPLLFERVFAMEKDIERLADALVNTKQMIVLSRGIALAAGLEIALKLQETCYLNARAYAISDFYHGPFALVGEDSSLLVFALKGKTFDDALAILEKLKPLGCAVTLFTQSGELAAKYQNSLLLPDADETLSPFVAAAAGQLLSLHLSLKRGLNPDKPRGLNKVTVTK